MGQERSASARRRGVAVGAALATWALAGPAVAAPVALAPVDVSAPGATAGEPLAGMDATGGLLVVWRSGAGSASAVRAVTRPPGGAPSAPVPISAPGAAVATPALAMAPSGEALAAWRRGTGDGDVVQAAGRSPGGPFLPGVDLSPPGAFAPQVALAPGGGAVVAWLRSDEASGSIVVETARRVPGGDFTPPATVSAPGGNALALQVAVDREGRVAVVWNQFVGRTTVVHAAVGTLTGGFAAPQPLSDPGEGAYDARVALTPAGGALVAWTRSDGAHARIQMAEITAGVAGEPATLSAAGADASGPRLAMDAAGEAVVAWRRGAAAAGRVQVALRRPGAPAGAPVDVSPAGVNAVEPEVAVDGAGAAVVTWRRADGSDPRVQIASRAAGGAFGAPVDVSTRGAVVDAPTVSLDGSGNGVVVWTRAAGDDDIVQMAGLDDAPPVLHDVTVPATAVAGVPVRLGARAFDVWSALAPGPTWSFGPGSGATGASVEHTFPAAGPYMVRVVQADDIGRVAVVERRVDVSPRAPVGALGAGALPPTPAPALRRPVTLRVGWGWARDRSRVWLRVRGRTAVALAGRTVLVERRVGRRNVALCRVPVRARGGFDGRCRVDRFARDGRIVVRVRARVTSSRTTRARAVPYVNRRAAAPLGPGRAPAR